MAGIITNAEEYARFVAFMLDAWPARDDRESGPVSRAARRGLALLHSGPRAPTFRKHQGREIATASAYGYGLVNSVESELGRYLHHRGGLPGYASTRRGARELRPIQTPSVSSAWRVQRPGWSISPGAVV